MKGGVLPAAKRPPFEMHSSYLTQMKRERPWYKRVNSNVLQQALRNQDRAFQNFFSGHAKFPQFKRTCDIDSFEFASGDVKYDESAHRVYLRTLGWMGYFSSRVLGESGQDYRVKTSWLKFEADGLYVVSLLDYVGVAGFPPKADSDLKTVNGLDRGINKIVAGADGEVTVNPRIGKKYERRLAIRQRRLSRQKKGSKNRVKAGKRVARVHQRIKRQREDFQWKLAKQEAAKADVIGLEDLNIKGMMARCKPKQEEATGKYRKNGQAAKTALSKAIADASWYSFENKLEHQAKKLGNRVAKVKATYSSQECSKCGYTSPDNRPEQEKFICVACGHHDDADIDAAKVIAQRTINKLGIDTLRVVSPKVTPKPESTGRRKVESRVGLPALPGTQKPHRETVSTAVQLNLFRPDIASEYGDSPHESPGIALSAIPGGGVKWE